MTIMRPPLFACDHPLCNRTIEGEEGSTDVPSGMNWINSAPPLGIFPPGTTYVRVRILACTPEHWRAMVAVAGIADEDNKLSALLILDQVLAETFAVAADDDGNKEEADDGSEPF